MADGKKPQELPGEFTDRIPTLHEVGSWFGPGEYIYSFSYKATTAGGGKKTAQLAEYPFELGPHWADTHKRFKRDTRIREHQEYLRKIHDEKLENMLENNDNLGGTNGLDELRKAAGTLKELGVEIGGAGKTDNNMEMFLAQQKAQQEQARQDRLDRQERDDKRQDFFIKMAGLIAPVITPILVEKLKSKPPAPAFDPQKQLEGTMSMISQIVDFKQDLTPEKESFGDKIFNIMEDVAPMLLKLAAEKGPEVAAKSPLIQAAKGSDDFKKAVNDQVSLHYLIEKMFKAHGPDNCNMMLQTLGIPLQVNPQGVVTPVTPGQAQKPTAENQPPAEEPPAKEEHPLEPASVDTNPPAE